MTDDDTLLSRRRLLDALGRLGDHLAEAGVVADLHIVGGAVMVTEHDARDSTADVDAFDYRPHGAVAAAALLVAEQMRLPRSWLNQQASSYVPRDGGWRRSSRSTTRTCTSTRSLPSSCWR